MISRKEALNKGLKTYFTGKPCKRNHICNRYTISSTCIECFRILRRQFRSTPEWKNKQRKRFEKKYAEQPWLYAYDRAMSRARRQNLPFNLTVEHVKDIWPKDNRCPIFKTVFTPNFGGKSGNALSPSLDRIVPSLGYIKGNVAIISLKANQIKSFSNDSNELRLVADWMEWHKSC